MLARDGAGEGKAQAHTARRVAAGFLEPDKGLEHLLEPVFRDSWAVIVNRGYEKVGLGLERHARGAAIPHRVLDQVAQGAADFIGPAAARRRSVNSDFDRQIELDQIVAHAFDQSGEIDSARLFSRT